MPRRVERWDARSTAYYIITYICTVYTMPPYILRAKFRNVTKNRILGHEYDIGMKLKACRSSAFVCKRQQKYS